MPRLIDADVLLGQMKHRRDYVGRPSDPVCLVEDAPTVGGWVSVKDRLPEDAKDVLINIVGLMPKIGCYLSTGWFEAVLGYEYESGYKVTHWMPLPEPPKEDEKHG